MAKKPDLTALMNRAKEKTESESAEINTPDPSAVKKEPVAQMGGTKEDTQPEKRRVRTVTFNEIDETELDRIENYLRDRGFGRIAVAKLIRISLRVAFKDGLKDSDLRNIYDEVMSADGRSRGE